MCNLSDSDGTALEMDRGVLGLFLVLSGSLDSNDRSPYGPSYHQPGRLEGMYKENAINPRHVTWHLKFPRFAVPADQTWSGFPGMASLVYRTSKSD